MGGRRLVVEADGGSRGNPGKAGYGALVRDAESGVGLAERAESVGIASNHVAEYSGLVAGFKAAFDIDPAAEVSADLSAPGGRRPTAGYRVPRTARPTRWRTRPWTASP